MLSTPSPTPTDMHRSMGKVPLDSQAPQAYTARHANSNSNANLTTPRAAQATKNVTIRAVPTAVVFRLRAMAAMKQMTMEAFLRGVLTKVSHSRERI